MHATLKDISMCNGVKKAGQRVAGWGKLAWRNEEGQSFFSDREEPITSYERRSGIRERLLEV